MPTETALSQPTTPYQIDIQDYRTELVACLSDAWELAHQNIQIAQKKQRMQHDKHCKDVTLQVGDRVMVHMPGTVKGKAWKFTRPFHGPYRVITLTPTNAEVRLVDDPKAEPIFVSLERVKPCFPELPDVSWTGFLSQSKHKKRQHTVKKSRNSPSTPEVTYSGPVTRARARRLATESN